MKINYLCFILLIILNGSCALPLALVGLVQENTDKEIVFDEKFEAEIIEEPAYIAIYIVNENGEKLYNIISGEYNRIKIDLPEGVLPEEVELTSTAGTIRRTDDDPSVFSIFVKEANIAVEISANEKNGKAFGYLMTETVFYPIPSAILAGEDNGQISTENFIKQGQLLLNTQKDVPVLCKCTEFRLIRIDFEGKRESSNNVGDAFSLETMKLTAKAVPGDIYIFENISVNCPGYIKDKQSRNLVYIMK